MGAVLPGRLAFDSSKQALLGSVIGLFDTGFTLQQLTGAVLRLPVWDVLTGRALPTNTDIANYLLTNINGVAPDQATLSSAVAAMNAESFATQGTWLAGLELSTTNQIRLGLAGLADTGLVFT